MLGPISKLRISGGKRCREVLNSAAQMSGEALGRHGHHRWKLEDVAAKRDAEDLARDQCGAFVRAF